MSFTIQKLSCKASYKTPFFYNVDYCIFEQQQKKQRRCRIRLTKKVT